MPLGRLKDTSPEAMQEYEDFFWLKEPSGPLKDKLDDDDQGRPGAGKRWYRRIEGDWYLFLDDLFDGSHD